MIPAPSLSEYESVIGTGRLEELREIAKRVQGRRILMVSSTRSGGGVAEILNRMILLTEELGLKVDWEILQAPPAFYDVTKKLHNALHGKRELFSAAMRELFLRVNQDNAKRLTLEAEIVFIHDPQPIALIKHRRSVSKSRWVWRCHIDLSRPMRSAWELLAPWIPKFDAAIYSSPAFAQRMPMRQVLIPPSIDPLSDKNRPLPPEEVQGILKRLAIPQDRPIITQVSRFDYLKDPIGVIEAFRQVRRSFKCRLVLAGGPATDDPEGEEVLDAVRERANRDPEIHILMLPPHSDLEINALQQASSVVIQKSIREGFGLTVAEALWKSRPVVASAVGGIPLQVRHRYSGLLVHSIDGAAFAIKQLLGSPEYARRLGENGREHVRQNFLLTRELTDYLAVFASLDHAQDTIHL